jgi:hypothetical protein
MFDQLACRVALEWPPTALYGAGLCDACGQRVKCFGTMPCCEKQTEAAECAAAISEERSLALAQ